MKRQFTSLAEVKDSKPNLKLVDPGECELCGYSEHTQRHRIIQGKDGGKYKRFNVLFACSRCHWELDRGFVPRSKLFRIVFARLAEMTQHEEAADL